MRPLLAITLLAAACTVGCATPRVAPSSAASRHPARPASGGFSAGLGSAHTSARSALTRATASAGEPGSPWAGLGAVSPGRGLAPDPRLGALPDLFPALRPGPARWSLDAFLRPTEALYLQVGGASRWTREPDFETPRSARMVHQADLESPASFLAVTIGLGF